MEPENHIDTFPVIIERAKTEFVLVGNILHNHGILMISSHASIELIGAEPLDKGGAKYGSIKTALNDWKSILGLNRINWATSNIIGADPDKEIKGNTITIIWKGYSTESMRKHVKEALDNYAYDIIDSLTSGGLWEQIKAIGPVLSKCETSTA